MVISPMAQVKNRYSLHTVGMICGLTEIRKNVVALRRRLPGFGWGIERKDVFKVDLCQKSHEPKVQLVCQVYGWNTDPVLKFAEGMFLALSRSRDTTCEAIEGWNDQGVRWLRITGVRPDNTLVSLNEWVRVLSDGNVALVANGQLHVYDTSSR